jgi:hypothetical protein
MFVVIMYTRCFCLFAECTLLIISSTRWGWSYWKTITGRNTQWTCCTSYFRQMHTTEVSIFKCLGCGWIEEFCGLHTDTFHYNKTKWMHWFHKFILAWNSACFGQFLCPSSGVYSLYTRHWYVSYRFVDSFRAGPGWSYLKAVCTVPVWQIPLLSVQWIKSWWWAEEFPETCRVPCQSKFRKLVHLVGFIIKKFVTMHGHTNIKHTCFFMCMQCIQTVVRL